MATGTAAAARDLAKLTLRAAGRSDAGRVRQSNEDRFHLDVERGIFIVVDGVGGHAGGETAAETALLQVRARLERDAGSADERLREAITLANNEVFRLSRTNPAWSGMSCVLTAAVIDGDGLTIGHVGDSRCYLIRPGEIRKLTHDHSPVGEREDSGELDELDAMRHPRRNEVFRDVGGQHHRPDDDDFVEIVTSNFPADAAVLLCSDGLSDLVTSREMLHTATRFAGHPGAAVEELIGLANGAGGKDNITAIYVEGDAFAARAADARRWRGQPPGARERGRRSALLLALSHLGALLLGLALGGAAVYLLGDQLSSLLPRNAPPLGLRENRTLVVRQNAAAEFATIGDALAAARPGDTVLVGPGEYREQVHLRARVALVSEEPHRAVIRLPDDAEGSAVVVASGIAQARIEGFQITCAPGRLQTGLLIQDAEVEVQDTRISGAGGAGIDVSSLRSVRLRANDISDNPGVGVHVRGGGIPWLMHNAILRNGRQQPPKPGVLLDDGASPVLIGNVIADNGGEGVAGVPPADRTTVLRNNVFVADGRANARGALERPGDITPRQRR